MPTPKTLYKVIPFLRGSIALLTLGCFITLLSYPKHPGQVDFNIPQQLVLNAAILFSYSYALYTNNSLNHQPLSPIYRMSLICTAFVLSWVYGMGPLVKIIGGSECKAVAARGGCMMQLSVSIIEVVWTMLMFAEGLLTDKRNRDKAYRQEMGWAIQEEDHVLASRARAAQAAAEANGVVEYRPDLSLESAGGAGAARAGRRRVVGVDDDNEVEGEEIEMEEPLPPYMPKAQSNQAVIIDMTNVRRPRRQGQLEQEQQELGEGGDHPSSHEVQEQGQEDTQGQQEQQVDRMASRLGGVSMSLSSSSSTIAPAQLPPLLPAHQQQQQQHPDAIHPQGGPGTGLPRVPSYSE
ncbi:hypothetical protein EC957_011306 [Mortierella hygrophila]|uniref:Uncharacterized protein n=1 Tax=Mortierella hygrophila TaxID=979708 RepID=A0A9P6F9I1_9FUNG|nr:hypothetical protein EC957_011306 [Mortierella hygrophila]